MANRIHVERGVQFKADLYTKPNRTEWLTEVGKELEKRKLTITVAPGITVKNADDLVKFVKRYETDKTGLKAALNLPATTTLENYVGDLLQALDDTVKTTSTVQNQFIDFQPASPMGKLLGLETSSRYASTTTAFGKGKVDAVTTIEGIELSKLAPAKDPLEGQLYMDSKTFANMPQWQWNRDGVELEQVVGIGNVDAKDLLKALRTTNNNGRTAFQRLRKPEMSEAYVVGYSGLSLDDMRWDKDAHAQREANKFVSLTVESGRYEPPNPGEAREVTLGTDKMDDTYYDTKDFGLTDADFAVRARARWDTDTEIRRILVAVKSNTVIDEFGVKRNGKVDIRNDSASPEEIASLDKDVRTGVNTWNGGQQPFGPLKGVYDTLNQGGKLPDIGEHTDVLQLEPKFHIRSVRSRYHLNETTLNGLQTFYTQTTGKLDSVLALSTAAQATATGGDKKTLDGFVADAQALKDGTALVKEVEAELKKLDPNMTVDVASVTALMPMKGGANDQLTLEKKRVVADGLDKLYHLMSEKLDGARRVITSSQDRTWENHPPMFMAWVKSTDKALVDKRTFDPFLAKYDAIAADPKQLDAFNDFGEAQKKAGAKEFKGWQKVTPEGFKALRAQLVNEVVRVNQRQLEAAGSTAKALYYEDARRFYVPGASRNTGNFLIDTTDMSEYVKHDDWESIPEADRLPAKQLPADKVFHAGLVNETQIELGMEKPYLDRLTELQNQIHGDRAGLVMRWLDSTAAAGIDAAKPETYQAALKTVLEQNTTRRNSDLDALNAFMKAQGSALEPVGLKDLQRLVSADFKFTAAQKTAPVRTEKTTERMLEGAKWVFAQIIDVQKAVVGSKEKRIMDVLEGAGLKGATWEQTKDSKGNTAMDILRGKVA